VDELEQAVQVPLRGEKNNEEHYRASYNVAPTQYQPVILQRLEDLQELKQHQQDLEATERHSVSKIKRCLTGATTDFPQNSTLLFMRWHLPISATFQPHNARDDSLIGPHAKPCFSRFKRYCRCIILANGYYEWQAPCAANGNKKTPFYFSRQDKKLCYFAGLYGWLSGKFSECLPSLRHSYK
jgi:putative SOS response-associated peptidase YedK